MTGRAVRPLLLALGLWTVAAGWSGVARTQAPVESAHKPALPQAPVLPPIRVVSTAWLADHLRDPNVVVIQIEMDAQRRGPRIAGAHTLRYNALVQSRDGLSTELPSPDSLAAVFASLGVSDSTLVVVTTSHEPPMAARALMTLDYIGHHKLAFLNGGVRAWQAEGRAMSTAAPPPTRGSLTVRVRPDVVVTADWITARQARGGEIALIDTRTDGEYTGTGDRHGMPSDGHAKGAQQLQWEQLFADDARRTLLDSTSLRRLYSERMQPGSTVVTYCWIGYRASMTYVAARMLGLPVHLYDGSYQDWQKRRLPVVPGR